MKKKINYNLPILNNLLNRKHNLIIFLLILIGVIVPSVSGNPFATLYEKIYAILTNPLFNFFFFLAVGISCIYAKCEFSKSYNLISRVGNYKKFIKENIKYIFIETIFWYIIAIILSLSGAFLLCLGEYGLVNHPNYDFNILYYLIFFCIRGSVIAGLVNVIIYLISNFLKNKFTIVLLLALNILFLIVTKQNTINNFYNMSILYHNYFLNINYVSFLLEVLCTFLECTLLLMIKKFMFKVIISKKRDLV